MYSFRILYFKPMPINRCDNRNVKNSEISCHLHKSIPVFCYIQRIIIK